MAASRQRPAHVKHRPHDTALFEPNPRHVMNDVYVDRSVRPSGPTLALVRPAEFIRPV